MNKRLMNKIIGLVEICGGIWGIMYLIVLLYSGFFNEPTGGTYLIFFLFLGFSIFLIKAGLNLFKKDKIILSLVAQFFQIIQVMMAGVLYQVYGGPFVNVIVSRSSYAGTLNFNFGFKTGFSVYLNSQIGQNGWILGINVLALLIFIYLFTKWRQRRTGLTKTEHSGNA